MPNYRQEGVDLLDQAHVDDKCPLDVVEKLLREIHELKRTREEAVAAAHAQGYHEGQLMMQRSIRSTLGLG